MIRGTLALLVASGLFAFTGCVIRGDADGEVRLGHGQADLNEKGCIPSGVVDRHALCLCGNLEQVGSFDVRPGPNASEASIGVNGTTSLVDSASFDGSFYAYGGFDAVASATVQGDLVSAEHVSWVGDLSVASDLVAGKGLDGVGDLQVGGALRVRGDISVVGDQAVGSIGGFPGDVAPPCACPGTSWFDVAQAVSDARTDNDNSTGAIDSVGATTLHLPSGRYFFESLSSVGTLHIVADGHVAIFVAGSIDTVGSDAFEIADGGSLDLYVAGSVSTVGNVAFGSAERPDAFRLLVGGSDAVLVNVGNAVFYGQIYAPTANIDFVGNTAIHGAVLGYGLSGVGSLVVESGALVSTPEETCRRPQEPEGSGGAGGDPAPAGAGGADPGDAGQGGAGGTGADGGASAGGACPS